MGAEQVVPTVTHRGILRGPRGRCTFADDEMLDATRPTSPVYVTIL